MVHYARREALARARFASEQQRTDPSAARLVQHFSHTKLRFAAADEGGWCVAAVLQRCVFAQVPVRTCACLPLHSQSDRGAVARTASRENRKPQPQRKY